MRENRIFRSLLDATNCTKGEELSQGNIAKLLMINNVALAAAGSRIARCTGDEVSLADHEEDERQGARVGRGAGKP